MGNKRDHLMDQMDLLTSPYSDFIMDDREMLFHSIAGASLQFVQSSPGSDVSVHNILHRGAVAGVSLASADLLLHVVPLPMEQLILHDVTTVCSWPHAARGELFAVARRDIAVARRNLAQLTHYVDLQDEHLAACDGALDDGLPLMSVEMCSRPTGGVRSVLDVAGRSK